MTKNSLFILVIILVVGFGIWFTKFGQELKRTQEIVNEKHDDTQRLLRRRTAAVTETPVAATPDNSLKKFQLQQEVQALAAQVFQENQKLETQRQYLDDLRNRTNPASTDISYRNQVSTANREIQYLADILRSDQFNETDVQREVERIQAEQNSAVRFYQEQMDQNIKDQEILVRRTQEDLQYWSMNLNDLTLRDQNVQILQQQLADQNQQLQDMKVQRLEIAARALENMQAVQAQARQLANDNSQARADIQDEISSLREDIQRLESNYRQTRFTQMSAQSQVQQAERNIQGQQEVIRSIQELLREKQEQLNQLQ
jgi:chromosome segregation ATPase